MGIQHFYGNGSRPLFWPGWRAAREEIAVSATPNRLNYPVNSVVYTQFTYMEAGRTIHIGGPRVGNPYNKSHGTSADWFL